MPELLLGCLVLSLGCLVLSPHKKGSLTTKMLIAVILPIGPMAVLFLWGDKTPRPEKRPPRD
jgi:hypothetical protein